MRTARMAGEHSCIGSERESVSVGSHNSNSISDFYSCNSKFYPAFHGFISSREFSHISLFFHNEEACHLQGGEKITAGCEPGQFHPEGVM